MELPPRDEAQTTPVKDGFEVAEILRELEGIRVDMLTLEREEADRVNGLPESNRASARNLLDYLALRRRDIRPLQERLARFGLSSLGRAECHVQATLESVIAVLRALSSVSRPQCEPSIPPVGYDEGIDHLEACTQALLGPEPDGRAVRIMVTMPSEASEDYALVRSLLERGMNCMRVNCAHDDAEAWGRMIANLRRAERELGKPCRVLMDLGGPKLRTGPIEPGPRVLKWRPQRDDYGRVTAPARVWLFPKEHPWPPPSKADACLPFDGRWLAELAVGHRIKFTDTRGATRRLVVTETVGDCRWAESTKTAYVAKGTRMRIAKRDAAPCSSDRSARTAKVGELPPKEPFLFVNKGDTLVLTRDLAPGRPPLVDDGRLAAPATIGCTLPEVFTSARPHERIWFDDGKIGGVITAVAEDRIQVAINHAKPGGAKLRQDKGINLPDTDLKLPPLTDKDCADLPFIAEHADLIGYSFVREPGGVAELRSRLERLNGEHVGLVLKIETQRGFGNLPALLLEAMRGPSVGVMIARGDLAIECGYERLAEVQEEILWICEAAHVPVIWATQVLESLAQEGRPSRAEITDAAMGQRAECVMLNKGPHILAAVQVLDDILRRMQAHQTKKRSLLRQLRLANPAP